MHYFSGIAQRTKKRFFRWIRILPAVRRKIENEIGKVSESMEASVRERTANMDYYTSLPGYGLSKEEILKTIDEYLALGEFKWKEGRVSGAVYNFNDDLCNLVGTVYEKTSYTNPLHSDIFPGINKMEAEVVRMCANMFNGGPEAVGTVCWHSPLLTHCWLMNNLFVCLSLRSDDNRRHRVVNYGMQGVSWLWSRNKRHHQTKYCHVTHSTFWIRQSRAIFGHSYQLCWHWSKYHGSKNWPNETKNQ